MTKVTAKSKIKNSHWAVGLCFAACVMTSLEALHPGSCAWMGLNAEQSFALSSTIATVMAFLAAYILTEVLVNAASVRSN